MTAKELKSLLNTLREAGVTHYKTADLELTLEPAPQHTPLDSILAAQGSADLKAPLSPPYSEDDILTWSSAGP